MKSLHFPPLNLLIISALVGLFTNCHPESAAPAATSACQIQQSISTSKSQFSTSVSQTDYTYDATGRLLKSVTNRDSRPTSGTLGAGTYSETVAYTYDTDGYLTGINSQQKTRTIDPTGPTDWQFTSISSYSYTNGLLTQKAETSTNPPQAFPAPTISTYEYDAAGNLTRIRANQSTAVYEKNKLVDYVITTATGELRPYTIQNGMITKWMLTGTDGTQTFLAQYDDQQRQLLNETYQNDQLTDCTTQTWSDAKPATASLPTFKGIPILHPYPFDQFSGREGVLSSRKRSYWNSISKMMQVSDEQTSVVQTNAQGYVTSVTTSGRNPYVTGMDYTVITTYTYAGCQ